MPAITLGQETEELIGLPPTVASVVSLSNVLTKLVTYMTQ